jgi:hypothetical protein
MLLTTVLGSIILNCSSIFWREGLEFRYQTTIIRTHCSIVYNLIGYTFWSISSKTGKLKLSKLKNLCLLLSWSIMKSYLCQEAVLTTSLQHQPWSIIDLWKKGCCISNGYLMHSKPSIKPHTKKAIRFCMQFANREILIFFIMYWSKSSKDNVSKVPINLPPLKV